MLSSNRQQAGGTAIGLRQSRAGSKAGGGGGWQLRRFAEATLGNGSLRKAVRLPEGEDLNEWLAVNGEHLLLHLLLLLLLLHLLFLLPRRLRLRLRLVVLHCPFKMHRARAQLTRSLAAET